MWHVKPVFFFLHKNIRSSVTFYFGNRYTVTQIPYNFIHDFCFMWAAVVYFLMLIYGISFVKGFECSAFFPLFFQEKN